MRIPVAPNVVAESLPDALRIAISARRIGSPRTLRRMELADTSEERDQLMRRWSHRALRAANVRVDLRGREHVPSAEPHIILALHESLIDVPLLVDSLRLPMTFVARADLGEEPPIAGLLRTSRQIMITPESPGSLRTIIREAALLQAQRRNLAIFPQGSVLGIEVAFQQGARVVAEQLEMPVLPIVIARSHRVWERPFSSLVRRGQQVYVEVLPPRRIEGRDDYRALEREMKDAARRNPWAAPRRFVPELDGWWDGYRFQIDEDYPDLVARHQRHTGRVLREAAVGAAA